MSLSLGLALFFAAPLALPQRTPELDPATYTSASGAFELHVDPSHIHGRGPGRHELVSHGKRVWSQELAFTLWNAVVADDGVVAGYAYSNGEGGVGAEWGTLHVLVIGPDGAIRGDDVMPRQSLRIHEPPDPIAAGLFLDPARDRVVVRLYNSDRKPWSLYRLSDGAKSGELDPTEHLQLAEERWARFVEARPIAGTALILISYYSGDRSDDSMGYYREGALYTLVDGARPVWTLSLPHDFTVENDEKADDALERLVTKTGTVLATEERSFALWHVADRARVTYRVEETDEGSGWTAREIRRTPFEPPAESQPVTVPEIHLRHLASVALRGDALAPPAIRDISTWTPLADGSIAFVRIEGYRAATAVWIDREGRVLEERALPPFDPPGADGATFVIPRSGDVWLGFDVDPAGETVRIWRVFAREGRNELVVGTPPYIEQAALTSDGGFLVSGEYSVLSAFGPDGELRWQRELEGQHYANPEDPEDEGWIPFNPDSVLPLEDGRIVVTCDELVRVLSADGSGNYGFRLGEILGDANDEGEEISYGDISWDGGDGLLVELWRQEQRFARVGLDGTLRARFDVRAPDGTRVRDVRVAPDGSLWGTAGPRFLRFDERDVALREAVEVLGEPFHAAALDRPGAVGVDPHGRIHVQDGRTGAVHVFDASGSRVRLCEATPQEAAAAWGHVTFAFAPSGEVLVSQTSSTTYVRFAADGSRIGTEDAGVANLAFTPDGRRIGCKNALVLQDARGVVQRTIERRPGDRRWIRGGTAVVARDGTFAVVSNDSNRDYLAGPEPGAQSLALFSRMGEPTRLVPLPTDAGDELAFDGRWAALSGWQPVVHLVDFERDECFRFAIPNGQPTSRHPFFSPDGRELWMVESGDQEVHLHRFALPE